MNRLDTISQRLLLTPVTGVPDGVSLADDRADRSGFDGLVSLPMLDTDSVVSTWGYAPIPDVSGFTLIAREEGRVVGQMSASLTETSGAISIGLEAIVVASDRRGSGTAIGLRDALVNIFRDAMIADPDLAECLETEPWGDFNDAGQAFASGLEEEMNKTVAAVTGENIPDL